MICRGCGSKLRLTFLDLGSSPIANKLLSLNQLENESSVYPLHVMTCEICTLVQLSENIPRDEIFTSDYTYFSSFSTSWLKHSKLYVEKMITFLNLKSDDLVLEIASNDGYLLQYFAAANIQTLGIESSSNVANFAIEKGLPTLIDFFGESLAIKLSKNLEPKLIVANNVLAHVPDIHDFIKGFSILLKGNSIATFEFPHLVNLMINRQFDTIYHEHYLYLTIYSLMPIFTKYGLKIFRVEKLTTHGGSLRIYVAKDNSKWEIDESVQATILLESSYDPRKREIYRTLQKDVLKIKRNLLESLIDLKSQNKKVAAYGAAAKGISLLNYCGIQSDLINYVIDKNPIKQGKYLPNSKIPIMSEEILRINPPDTLLVLPWNLAEEIKAQLIDYIENGMRIFIAIPNVEFI